MTNGAGGPHEKKRGRNGVGKKAKPRDAKASLKRKGLLPAALDKGKQA